MLNLDTHILIWAIQGGLTVREKRILSEDEWSISAIVLWEISKLAQLGRIDIDLDTPEFSRLFSRLQVWPVSLEVCRAIRRLDFQGDPADEIIAATSLVHHAALVTRDRKIRSSRRVPLC
jgi:PIN domain nuclease of toxin-antitoxin system